MCTTTALETALRACIRKAEGVHCASIAVDANSFLAGGAAGCGMEPVATRFLRSIYQDRLLINAVVFDTNTGYVECQTTPSTEELLQRSLIEGDAGKARCIWATFTSDNPLPECQNNCDLDGLSLTELFKRSLRSHAYYGQEPCLQVVEGPGGELPIACDDATPLETLLRMCAAIMPDGSVAWRIQSEA